MYVCARERNSAAGLPGAAVRTYVCMYGEALPGCSATEVGKRSKTTGIGWYSYIFLQVVFDYDMSARAGRTCSNNVPPPSPRLASGWATVESGWAHVVGNYSIRL